MNSWKTISLPALAHNVRTIRSFLKPGVGLCLVLKAHAYGHGLDNVLQCREILEADSIAVIDLGEAIAVCDRHSSVRCLLPFGETLSLCSDSMIQDAIRAGVIFCATTQDGLKRLGDYARSLGTRVRVDIMLDTGMHRGEADADIFPAMLEEARSSEWIRLEGVSTHYCDADTPEAAGAKNQLANFNRIVPQMPGVVRHTANTAALLKWPESHFEMVRAGIGLYGVVPFESELKSRFRLAMRWETRIVDIKRISAGEGPGYGPTWRASRDTCIGLLPVGYYDGVLRKMANQGEVIIRGKAYPIVGTVSMNLITVDLGPETDAKPGDTVVLIDDELNSPASAYQWAEKMGSIPYEVLTSVGTHAPTRLITEG